MIERDEVREVLASAMELVMLRWCQGSNARDAYGDIVPAASPKACSWCAAGAITAVSPQSLRGPAHRCLSAAIGSDPHDTGVPILWNDHPDRTQAEVIAALARSVDHAEGGGAL